MLTNNCPLSDFADTLCAQLQDGELSDQIRSLWRGRIGFWLATWKPSRARVIAAASWRRTTINSSTLICTWPISKSWRVWSDHTPSHQYSSSWLKAPPLIGQASPKLVNWGSRGMTRPMLIDHGRLASAIREWSCSISNWIGAVISFFVFVFQIKDAVSRVIRESRRWWRSFGSWVDRYWSLDWRR